MGLSFVMLLLFSYLLGSVPFGLLLGRLLGGVDPRSGGSGNIGATNVSRQAGKTAGVLTLLLDAAKGAAPTAMGLLWLEDVWAVAAVGLAAFLGHVFPIYLRFKGGKGVATALGIFAVLAPWGVLGILGVLVLGAWLSGHMSVGSMVSWGTAPLWMWISSQDPAVVTLAAVVGAGVVLRHRENLRRLRSGHEHGWR